MKKRTAGWKSFLLTLLALVWIFAIPVLAEEGGSGDNSLSTLGITTEGVTVSPDFVYSTIEYNVTVPAGTKRLELSPVTSNENAWIVDITGQDIGEDDLSAHPAVGQGIGTVAAHVARADDDDLFLLHDKFLLETKGVKGRGKTKNAPGRSIAPVKGE